MRFKPVEFPLNPSIETMEVLYAGHIFWDRFTKFCTFEASVFADRRLARKIFAPGLWVCSVFFGSRKHHQTAQFEQFNHDNHVKHQCWLAKMFAPPAHKQ